MYFGHVFGWNVVTRSLNAATNNMSVISSKIQLLNKIYYANYKSVSKKKQRQTDYKK